VAADVPGRFTESSKLLAGNHGMSLRLSVVVPFHRDPGQLRQCLVAVQAAGAALPAGVEVAEVIVAADGARDDPAGEARETGATVLFLAGPRGPAVARNRGAAIATGDLLVFVDTDVVMHARSLAQFAALFSADATLGAAFGAYDVAPASQAFLSQSRNLGHAFIHRRANPDAETFWAGLGAVRATAFRAAGGFDERFARPSVEDIDLGYRIRALGWRIAVDAAITGKHLKHWTFRSAIITDVRDRGIPWTQLTLRYGGMHDDLNITLASRASVIAAYLLVFFLVWSWWRPLALAGAAAALAALLVLDWPLYRDFARLRGSGFALRWLPVRTLHHLCNGLSFAAGAMLSVVQRGLGIDLPGALPSEPWPAIDAKHRSRGGG
jgi:GT2 family glycosyltransferase